MSQEVSSADNSRHYGYYIDGDIAKLPGGGRRGAAVLCELIPGKRTRDARYIQASLSLASYLMACLELVLYGIRIHRWLPCTERIYYRRTYAIKSGYKVKRSDHVVEITAKHKDRS